MEKKSKLNNICHKKSFDKIGAMLILSKVKSSRNSNFNRREKRYYFCNQCKSYHLTSKDEKTK